MDKMNQDIRERSFKSIYLLFGDEDYLCRRYKKLLKDAMVAPGDTMNCSFFTGDAIEVEEMLSLAETMPFLSERRVIVVEDSGFFKSSQERLAEYFSHIPDTTHFIFLESEVNKTTATYKAAAKYGYAAQLNKLNVPTLTKWLLSRISKEGYKITQGAVDLFLQYTGQDMNRIDTELEKLFCYKMDNREIRQEDVDAVTCRNIEDHIFVMTDAAARQNRQKALDEYYDLLALKVGSGFILNQLIRQINLMYQTAMLRKKGYDQRQMAEKTGLTERVVGIYLRNSQLYTTERLRHLLEQGALLMEQQRNGFLQENLAVELFLIDASSKKR